MITTTMAISSKVLLILFAIALSPSISDADEVTTTTVTECHYGNKTYKIGEEIITERVCKHCTCEENWTGVIDYDKCAIIDCPFNYYRKRTHCEYNYIEGKCCPVATCGPWHPDFDENFIRKKKRPKLSMDGVNVTVEVDTEFTLFCIDQSESATGDTLVTWQYKSADGIQKPVNFTNNHSGITDYYSGDGRHSWGLYFGNTKLEYSGQYICTIHTTPTQTETSFMFVKRKFTKKLNDICFDEEHTDTSCLYPADSLYYFNKTAQYCYSEKSTACAPVGNRFSNDDECRKHCYVYSCQGNAERGPCTNQFVRYFYNQNTDTCQPFMYGGCQGNIYGNNYETLEECNKVCEKIAFEDGTSEIAHQSPKCVPCPWNLWVHYLKQRCQPVWVDGACCPTHFQCTESRQNVPTPNDPDTSHECNWNNDTYNIGDEIPISGSCQICQCRTDFKGPGSPGCRPQICQREADTILQNTTCIPIYTKDECCPTEIFCPPVTDFAQSPPARLHPEVPELNCRFGKLSYPRGYQYKVKDQCLTCRCLTPPYFTCERIKCEYEAVDYCPSKAKSHCCCSHVDMLRPEPRAPKSTIEIAACEKADCSLNSTCKVTTLCTTENHCETSCQPCPEPENCTASGRPPRTLPYQCPDCIDPYTPEEACEWRNCTEGPDWCMVYHKSNFPRKYFQTVCESHEDRKQNYLSYFSIPLCHTECSSPCYLVDSVDNTCPICHCP